MRGKRIDANQNKIVEQLRRIPGLSVAITSALGCGFPDLVVGFKGRNFLFELKDNNKPPSQTKLTTDEERFHYAWQGQISIVYTLDDILKKINAV